MPVADWSEMPNNSLYNLTMSPLPAQVNGPDAIQMEITPDEKAAVDGIQKTAEYTQYAGLVLGAAAGLLYTRARVPSAASRSYMKAAMVGTIASPLWSTPLAYFLSRPYINQVEQDAHLLAVLKQSERAHTPLDAIPVSSSTDAGQPTKLPASSEIPIKDSPQKN